MSAEEHDHLRALSFAVFKNGSVFPVAVAFTRLADERGVASAPRVVVGLGGRLHANRVIEAMLRLERIGALAELPHRGPPVPRRFERLPSAFWSFVRDYCNVADTPDPAHDATIAGEFFDGT